MNFLRALGSNSNFEYSMYAKKDFPENLPVILIIFDIALVIDFVGGTERINIPPLFKCFR